MEDLGAVAQNALDQVVGHCAPRLSNIFNATATLDDFKSRQTIYAGVNKVSQHRSLLISVTQLARLRDDKGYGLKNDSVGLKET